MGDTDRHIKMEIDYSSIVDQKLKECDELMKDETKLNEALERLLPLEKQTRTAADAISTGRVLVAIVKYCYIAKQWEQMNEHIITLSKRRSQLKQAITKMVQEAYELVEKTPDLDTKLKLIETLRNVTTGKIFVENERARLTKKLSDIYEGQGKTKEAAEILQELQVETYGTMDRREKIEFLLEQMRLCLAKHDYVRTQIISKKINTKAFEDEASHDLKLKYYELMIEMDLHEKNYFDVCQHYKHYYETPRIKQDSEKMKQALKHVVLYLTLSSYNNEQSDFLHRLFLDKNLEEIPKYKDLLQRFKTQELIHWKDIQTNFENELKNGTNNDLATKVFTKENDGDKRWEDFKSRIVEHNIRIMAKYYTRVRTEKLANLLDLTKDEAEKFLSDLVSNKTIIAKIDRLQNIITFQQHKSPQEILNDWSINLNSLMTIINKTCHLINKEETVHAART
ncbi:unnamed protein product [Adineta steineri]|uniref:PCI domain-containing protein n=1 Tax=Adineta steineri TaxID=433720 RepID=A0A814P0N2_9BILA|nr:unnamed protein product [Adineta steineri]